MNSIMPPNAVAPLASLAARRLCAQTSSTYRGQPEKVLASRIQQRLERLDGPEQAQIVELAKAVCQPAMRGPPPVIDGRLHGFGMLSSR
jgi:hypothetical protein